jgi:hypothetical protein
VKKSSEIPNWIISGLDHDEQSVKGRFENIHAGVMTIAEGESRVLGWG